jgi:hypothetical protein
MLRTRHFILSSLAAGAIALAAAGIATPRFASPALAADAKAADKDKTPTRADRVRDAIEHLKKAKEQLDTANVDDKGHDGAAFLKVKEAITECEKYLEQVGDGKKAQ